jgi:hypothetical protein
MSGSLKNCNHVLEAVVALSRIPYEILGISRMMEDLGDSRVVEEALGLYRSF